MFLENVMNWKKFQLLFIIALSLSLVFSCSSKNNEKEEVADDNNVSQDDDSGYTKPDETSNYEDKNDTAPEQDDSDDIVISDIDTSENDADTDSDDDFDYGSDIQPGELAGPCYPDNTCDEGLVCEHYTCVIEKTDDSDTTAEPNYDPAVTSPDIPVVFGNICTGQTKCYDETAEINCPAEGEAFYGQDAEYAKSGKCIPQKFTVKGTGDEKIVFDENLKLEWQQKIPEGSFDWQSAANHCEKEYAGSYGWRLPTPKELLSIVDNGRYDPAINTDLFPGTNDEWFWTSADFASTDEADKDKKWFVRFDKGFLSHKAKTESEKMHVRCVRGTTLPDGQFETEKIGEDEIVKDSVTGLMWQKTYKDGVKKFADALSTCETLEYAGFSDWRLPNKNELASIANYGKYKPASDFPEMPNRSFRTSTSDTKSSKNAWYILFSDSDINFGGKSNSDYVRCVRRGE